MRRGKKPGWIKALAEKRISRLFSLAKDAMENNEPHLAQRYVELAGKISKKYNVRIPNKREYCRKCYSYWIPGKTVKVTHDKKNKRVVYTCKQCGARRSYSTGS